MTQTGQGPVEGDWQSINEPVIARSGFREYDARWRFPDEINLPGMFEFGAGLGTQLQESGACPEMLVGCDFRSYSVSVKHALALGLVNAGIAVTDIGTVITPMAYFARKHFKIEAVAMVTASHNPNGWTGVKTGFRHPLTHGDLEMERLRQIVLDGRAVARPGGSYRLAEDFKDHYFDDVCNGYFMTRKLRAVCATGNGTASIYAPELLERIGLEVVHRHTRPDTTFPNYNPNPESITMLRDMSEAVISARADLALGFDGDGDRLGVVDDEGEEISPDKIGVLLARRFGEIYPSLRFIADVKSTALFATDPVLRKSRIETEYWKTGHSHMKHRLYHTLAHAGFEKSGHFYFSNPFGNGYDCGLKAAVELCKLLDNRPGKSLSDLKKTLPETWMSPTISPPCPDSRKYEAAENIGLKLKEMKAGKIPLAGSRIEEIIDINGTRANLSDGSWGLVRASSNTPNLVVVCESTRGPDALHQLTDQILDLVITEPGVGRLDATI